MSLKDIPQDWRVYYDPTAVIIVVEFLLFQALLYALPVGNIIQGPKTYSGKKPEYRMNGKLRFVTIFKGLYTVQSLAVQCSGGTVNSLMSG